MTTESVYEIARYDVHTDNELLVERAQLFSVEIFSAAVKAVERYGSMSSRLGSSRAAKTWLIAA
jgi:hypothetical protein